MIPIFTVPSRGYNNRSFTTNLVRLSQHIAMPDFWFVLLRMEIETADAGATLQITYSMRNGADEYIGGSTGVYSTPGKYQVGFARSDFDANTMMIYDILLTGRMDLNGVVYICERGEDIPEWL